MRRVTSPVASAIMGVARCLPGAFVRVPEKKKNQGGNTTLDEGRCRAMVARLAATEIAGLPRSRSSALGTSFTLLPFVAEKSRLTLPLMVPWCSWWTYKFRYPPTRGCADCLSGNGPLSEPMCDVSKTYRVADCTADPRRGRSVRCAPKA